MVSKGRLIVNGTHSGTGAVTVRSGAILAGKGSLAGAVTIMNGGILQVGDTLATDKGLTFKAGLKLNSGAILQLNDKMAAVERAVGATLKVFTGTATGTFAEIIPATPGEGLRWDTSELYTKGTLKVADDANAILSVTDAEALQTEYFTLSGERVEKPGKGLYLVREKGKNQLKKVLFR